MDNEQLSWHRWRHTNTEYLNSFTGSPEENNKIEKYNSDGPKGKTLFALVHWPVSIATVLDTVGRPAQWAATLPNLDHAQIAGVMMLSAISVWSLVELFNAVRDWRS